MGADWAALQRYLKGQGIRVDLSWHQLEDIVGGMPASAINHSVWWGGDRPHTRAWRAAGYEVESRIPGQSVVFVRRGAARSDLEQSVPRPPAARAAPVVHRPSATADAELSRQGSGVLLVSCSKSKLRTPSPARDLYSSPRFRKARGYAEGRADPWYILSAEHGLVGPDEWLAPYDRHLSDTSRSYRQAWGEWVVARLDLLLGGLRGRTVEIHAGQVYVDPLREPLRRAGASLEIPLAGLSTGLQQQWYDERPTAALRSSTFSGDVDPYVRTLSDAPGSTPAADVRTLAQDALAGPGLYAWFVDQAGASDLSRGLGEPLGPGLIYVGQTGATKWPTGIRSNSTLRGRLLGQHLGRRRSASTLRRTLGAILDESRGQVLGPAELTAWMTAHLHVTPMIVAHADQIGDLERQVVQRLDPPLNLDHVRLSPIRVRFKTLRVAAAGRE